jgi:hypothetical protein
VPCSSVNPISIRNCGIDIYVALTHVMKDELVVFNRVKLHVLYNRLYNTFKLCPIRL